MNVENTDSSDNPLRGKIPSISEIQDLTAKHREKEEKRDIENCRKAIVEAFKRWESNQWMCRCVVVKCFIPKEVEKELKELGYGIEIEDGEWFITW